MILKRRYEVGQKEFDIDVHIDIEAICKDIALSAARTKSGKATALRGLIVGKILSKTKEQP